MKRALLAGVMTLALCGSGVADDETWYTFDLGKSCVRSDKTPDEFVKLMTAQGYKVTPSTHNSELVVFYSLSKDGKDEFVSMAKGREFCERMLTLTKDAPPSPNPAIPPPPVIVDPPVLPTPPKAMSEPPRNNPPAYESVVDDSRWDVPVVHKTVKPTRRYAYHRRHYRHHEEVHDAYDMTGPVTTVIAPLAPPANGSIIYQEPLPPPPPKP
jgi:hypothetical protein